jgi:hypothetical protein
MNHLHKFNYLRLICQNMRKLWRLVRYLNALLPQANPSVLMERYVATLMQLQAAAAKQPQLPFCILKPTIKVERIKAQLKYGMHRQTLNKFFNAAPGCRE